MIKTAFLFGVIVSLSLLLPYPVNAAKKRVWSTKAPVRRAAAPSGVAYSSVKLSRPTNSVVINFLNTDKVSSVTYALNYIGSGQQQGVVGTFTPSGLNSRDLYFGTCSKGVCTPHRNIRNATLTVTTNLTNGTAHTKRYRIKV